jgi:methylmalonyl-CoA/ethylmalonyl-CoA epimerase
MTLFDALDHIAIVVADTDEAITFYRDTLGFPVLFSEVLADQGVRLTHLDLGACHLQLVQPLTQEHPLSEFLRVRGEGLHHLCWRVENVPIAMARLAARGLVLRDRTPRRGPRGRQAVFVDPGSTRNVLLEITGEPDGT